MLRILLVLVLLVLMFAPLPYSPLVGASSDAHDIALFEASVPATIAVTARNGVIETAGSMSATRVMYDTNASASCLLTHLSSYPDINSAGLLATNTRSNKGSKLGFEESIGAFGTPVANGDNNRPRGDDAHRAVLVGDSSVE